MTDEASTKASEFCPECGYAPPSRSVQEMAERIANEVIRLAPNDLDGTSAPSIAAIIVAEFSKPEKG